MEENLESLFGINIFQFEEYHGSDEDGSTYSGVKFLFPSLNQYDGFDVSVSNGWDITIWSEEGQVVAKFSLIGISEYQEALKEKYNLCK